MNRHYWAMNMGDPVSRVVREWFESGSRVVRRASASPHVWNAHQDVRVVRRHLRSSSHMMNPPTAICLWPSY